MSIDYTPTTYSTLCLFPRALLMNLLYQTDFDKQSVQSLKNDNLSFIIF